MIENSIPRRRSYFLPFFFLLILTATLFGVRYTLLEGLPPRWHPPAAKLHWFEIRNVQIHTENPLTEEGIRKFLPNLEGESLLNVNPSYLYSILKNKPWVQEVSIKKEYPDRLTIMVLAKKAKAVSFLDGQPVFVDIEGNAIEKVPLNSLEAKELPFISGELSKVHWKFSQGLSIYSKLALQLGGKFRISEMQLTQFPTFKLYLSKPRIEILFSYENWEAQLPYLMTLLSGSPSQLMQIYKINLLFPKKAIVTRPISH